MATSTRARLPAPRAAREAAGLTQAQLAERIGSTAPSVCRWEKRGKYPQHPAIRRAYLAALGLAESAS